MSVAELFKKARLDKGLSQEAAAQRAGLSWPTVHRIETGKVSPTSRSLMALAGALDLDLQKLQDAMGSGKQLSNT